MVDAEAGLFTVAVFQDAVWAEKAVRALTQAGFVPASLSIVAKNTPDAAALVEKTFGKAGERLELAELGEVVATGPLLGALQGGARDLAGLGLAGTMSRVGFQSHDCRIFETLTGRGGVLVAIHNEPRVSDALAICHSYGGGNAAIGAWRGRV
jgi:hypothetical protein